MKPVALHAGVVELRRQRESLGDVRIRAVEGRVEAGDLRELRRTLEQPGHGRQVVRLMQGRERDEALESLDRLGPDPHRRRELQTSVDDPVPDPHQPPVREVVLQKLTEILHRAIVIERRSRP